MDLPFKQGYAGALPAISTLSLEVVQVEVAAPHRSCYNADEFDTTLISMREKLENLSEENLRVRLGPVVFGDVLYAPGGVCGPRIQQDYQLVIMHRGHLNLQLDREWIPVPAGYAILLSPRHREHFHFDPKNETHHSWCSIRASALPPRLRRQFRRQLVPLHFGGELRELLESGRRSVLTDRGELQDGFFLGLGLALLCGFAAKNGAAPLSSADETLSRLGKTIREEYPSALSLTALARVSGVSSQHLLRLCRQKGLATPMKQLYARRLEVAADLLCQTGLSVAEVAERCGFVQPLHFSRRFLQAYGANPLAWRKAHWRK